MKRILLMMVVIAFASSATVSAAMAACNCPDMTPEVVSADMPCHDMADVDQSIDSDESSPQCAKCGCGHCTVSSKASLNQPSLVAQLVAENVVHPSYSNVFASRIVYGIDNPPKPIS